MNDGKKTATVPTANPAPARARATWRDIGIYYVMACGFSWGIWAPVVLGERGLKLLDIAPSQEIITAIGTLGPLVGCYVTHRLSTGNWRAVRLLPSRWSDGLWLLLGPLLVLPCLFFVLPMLISLAPPQAWLRNVDMLQKLPALMFNYTLLSGPLAEEFGWRGLLQPRLEEVLPPWAAAVAVGMMWAGWHLPLFFVDGWISISRMSYFFMVIGLSVIMAFGFNASGKTVVVAILMHSAFNASMQLVVAYLGDIPMRSYPKGEYYLAGAFLLPASILAIITRGRLAVRRPGNLASQPTT
jgi:uncharacterized protein